MDSTTAELLNFAVAEHRAGNLASAEQAYRGVLSADPQNTDAWHLLGLIAHQAGRDDLAVDYFQRAVTLRPNVAIYHANFGSALGTLGRKAEAAAAFQRALQLDPQLTDAHSNLGTMLDDLGYPVEAEAHLREALRLNPNFVPAHSNLGSALARWGRMAEGEASLRRALQIQPDFADAHYNLGIALREQDRIEEAAACYERALAIRPNHAEACHNLGAALEDLDRTAEAVAVYRHALQLRPNMAEPYNNLGAALKDLGQLDEAWNCLQEALRLRPNFAEAHMNLGTLLKQQGRMDEAIAHIEHAIRLRPNYAEAYSNLAAAKAVHGFLDQALVASHRSLELNPNLAETHNNLGATLMVLGKPDDALACYQRALQLKPQQAAAHYNQSQVWLLRGDLERGWQEYEWRRRLKDVPRREFAEPMWDGSPLAGKTILIYAEQGLGDTLQFIRYVPLVKGQGGTVIVECQPAILSLLARTPGIDQLVAKGQALPHFDVQAPLMSLPRIFGSTLANLPANVPYVFADPRLVETWQQEFAAIPEAKIGIGWQGNPKYRDDRYRSIPLVHFAPLAAVPGVRLFSLQKGFGAEQLAAATDQLPVLDLAQRLDEVNGAFMDTAAVMKSLDLVITSDTATAHLAGALGVPVWLALPFAPDWRWLLDREDSPYYPTMRLFRQPQFGDWPAVFQRMAHELSQVIGRSTPVAPPAQLETAKSLSQQGVAFARQGKLAEAVATFEQAVRQFPQVAESHYNLGLALSQQGHTDRALASYRRAIEVKPGYAAAHSNLGVMLLSLRRLEEAALHFEAAAKTEPDLAEVHCNLGRTLFQLGRYSAAVACHRRAIALQPDNPDMLNELGLALIEGGNRPEALAAFQQAAQRKPDFPEAHSNLGGVLSLQKKLPEAIQCLREALRLRPDFADACNNLGAVLTNAGQLDEAIQILQRSMVLQPASAAAHGNLLFALNYDLRVDADALYAEHLRWAERHAGRIARQTSFPNVRDPNRRLRIGYVSPDFRSHPVARFVEPILAQHSKADFEVFCYVDVPKGDATTNRLRGMVDLWRDTLGMADSHLAEMIRADQIDILVDLAGHTSHNRLLVFASKPAPVQVSYLGYPNTTGLAAIDYRLTDEVADPSSEPARYSEEVVRLSAGLCCFAPPLDAPPVSPLPALQTGVVTFGSLHSLAKLNASVIDLWCRILHAVSASRLLVFRDTLRGSLQDDLRRQFAQRGIAADRLDLRHAVPASGHLTVYDDIDIALDTFPWCGHTTACESLWMGAPMVTLYGSRHAGRMVASVLTSLGRREWIAATEQEYFDVALRLASNLDQLAEIRGKLREEMAASALCDGVKYTRALEETYRAMWKKYCSAQ
jgi:predicted O-linked N-acetylglucosamine transferase (SPINDLY family)